MKMQTREKYGMNKRGSSDSIRITWIIVGAIVILALIALIVFLSLRPGTTINANGSAQIKAMPDIVTVYFNVLTDGSTAKEAKDKNAEIVDNTITALIKKGFDRSEITTENFNVYPEYNWSSGRNEIIGYKATHSIKVQMSADDKDKAGDAIDAGVDSGALISYINFELSLAKQNEYKAQALKQATEDARIKATSIAQGLGKRVGGIVSVQDNGFYYNPWQIYRNDLMASGVAEAKSAISTNINPGEQDINAQVSVVFKLI